jgi:hypothetical protein
MIKEWYFISSAMKGPIETTEAEEFVKTAVVTTDVAEVTLQIQNFLTRDDLDVSVVDLLLNVLYRPGLLEKTTMVRDGSFSNCRLFVRYENFSMQFRDNPELNNVSIVEKLDLIETIGERFHLHLSDQTAAEDVEDAAAELAMDESFYCGYCSARHSEMCRCGEDSEEVIYDSYGDWEHQLEEDLQSRMESYIYEQRRQGVYPYYAAFCASTGEYFTTDNTEAIELFERLVDQIKAA